MDPATAYDDEAPVLLPISEEAVRLRIDPGEGWPVSLENEPELWVGNIREPFNAAGDIYRRYIAARAHHAADRHLTAEGKAAADVETAEKLLPEIGKLLERVHQSAAGVDRNLVKLAEAALTVPDVEDPYAPSPGEIRAWLRSLMEDEREDAVERLVSQGDVRALRAILSAPEALTGVPAQFAQELREDVIRKSDPNRHRKIMAWREGAAATERALEGVARFLAYDTSPNGIRDRLAYPESPVGQRMRIRAGG